MPAHTDAFSDLVLDTLRLQEAINAAQNAPAHEGPWFLQGSRQTLWIAGQHWMIRLDEACELLDPLPLAFLPHMPPWFCGLAHWHGQALPVLDLAPFWQLERQEQRQAQAHKTMLLVLGHGDGAAGVLLDRPPGHVHLADTQRDTSADLHLLAPVHMRSHIRGRYTQGKKAWFDIDASLLLADIERHLQHHRLAQQGQESP